MTKAKVVTVDGDEVVHCLECAGAQGYEIELADVSVHSESWAICCYICRKQVGFDTTVEEVETLKLVVERALNNMVENGYEVSDSQEIAEDLLEVDADVARLVGVSALLPGQDFPNSSECIKAIKRVVDGWKWARN